MKKVTRRADSETDKERALGRVSVVMMRGLPIMAICIAVGIFVPGYQFVALWGVLSFGAGVMGMLMVGPGIVNAVGDRIGRTKS